MGETTFRCGLGAALLALATGVSACAGYGPAGLIPIHFEDVILIWDDRLQLQTFIRRASFTTEETRMAFIVPVPSRPRLFPVDDRLFEEVVNVTGLPAMRRIPASADRGMLGAGGGGGAGQVRVVESQVVAGYRAVTLQATSAAVLVNYLRERKFPVASGTQDWLQPYIDRGFYLVALDLNAPKKGTHLNLPALGMTFNTPRPFYPWREPGPPEPSSRSGLRDWNAWVISRKHLTLGVTQVTSPSDRFKHRVFNGSRKALRYWPASVPPLESWVANAYSWHYERPRANHDLVWLPQDNTRNLDELIDGLELSWSTPGPHGPSCPENREIL